ncbi:hypothetical protein M426DRAFT_198937 [Hypoxylon sp. CI-4A]|nr:hypothetical protein M426DRAFT_198937 [Hypoxylon sp. CI-4A]
MIMFYFCLRGRAWSCVTCVGLVGCWYVGLDGGCYFPLSGLLGVNRQVCRLGTFKGLLVVSGWAQFKESEFRVARIPSRTRVTKVSLLLWHRQWLRCLARRPVRQKISNKIGSRPNHQCQPNFNKRVALNTRIRISPAPWRSPFVWAGSIQTTRCGMNRLVERRITATDLTYRLTG